MNRKRVIEIIAITVARRTVAGVAVERDTVGRVANKMMTSVGTTHVNKGVRTHLVVSPAAVIPATTKSDTTVT